MAFSYTHIVHEGFWAAVLSLSLSNQNSPCQYHAFPFRDGKTSAFSRKSMYSSKVGIALQSLIVMTFTWLWWAQNRTGRLVGDRLYSTFSYCIGLHRSSVLPDTLSSMPVVAPWVMEIGRCFGEVVRMFLSITAVLSSMSKPRFSENKNKISIPDLPMFTLNGTTPVIRRDFFSPTLNQYPGTFSVRLSRLLVSYECLLNLDLAPVFRMTVVHIFGDSPLLRGIQAFQLQEQSSFIFRNRPL